MGAGAPEVDDGNLLLWLLLLQQPEMNLFLSRGENDDLMVVVAPTTRERLSGENEMGKLFDGW